MEVRGLLLDVEGVLVRDKSYVPVETAVDFVREARRQRCPLRLITNNTTDDRTAIVAKLAAAGFDFAPGELHTCTGVAVARLRALGAQRCLVLGNVALRRIFADAGFEVVDDYDVDAVVVGLDTDLTYRRLQLACDAILSRGAAFLALHANRIYGDAAGRTAPSVGAIAAAVEFATQVAPTVVGKPNADYFRQALAELGVTPEHVLVVSDDPLTDLVGAKRLGLRAAFVLSGKYQDERVLWQIPDDLRPDLCAARVGDLVTREAIRFCG